MSIKGKAYIVGIYEHPTRLADGQVAGAAARRGAPRARSRMPASPRTTSTAISAPATRPGSAPLSMVDYMGLKLRHVDSTDTGGSSYLLARRPRRRGDRARQVHVALITLAGRPRAEGMATGTAPRTAADADARRRRSRSPTAPATANMYAMCAMRHMHEYGTTSEQLAWVKVAASHHAQYNPHAMLRDVVTVEDVVNSPMIADPLHRLDCCVISDGGGAIVVASPEIAKELKRPKVKLIGAGEAPKHQMGGKVDLTYSGAVWSGPPAFAEAGRQAGRHQVRLDLRQLHDHRADAARGSRLLREGPGRQVRRRRQPDLGHRQAAVQHRRRRAVQQPSGQSRRPDQGDRGGAPAARRGASRRCR